MIRFIVDSTFGVSRKFAEENKVKVVKLKMLLDGETTEEGFHETWTEFYEKLKNSKNFPTSSQPSPQAFVDAINEIYSEDENAEIFILTIGERLSGTINSATLAANSFEGKKIEAIDSGAACTCSFLMLEEMMKLANSGKTFEELSALAPKIKENLSIAFVPATMEYLKRSGRVGKLAASVLDILKIKPIFYFKNNELSVPKKSLGLAKAFIDAISLLPAKIKQLAVCYIYEELNLPKLIEKVKAKFPKLEIRKIPVSPMFGVHVGIGAVGVAALSEY